GEGERVVDRDDQADQQLPPADELGPAPEAAPRGGGRAAPAVTDLVVQEQQRDACAQQRDKVRQDGRAADVLVRDGGEAPDVAEADGGADGREDERGAGGEGAAVRARRGLGGGWGWGTHGCRLRGVAPRGAASRGQGNRRQGPSQRPRF